MILDYSYPDDLIYDPFIGGGTTAIAAHRTRRRFVGSDISPGNIEVVRRTVAEGQWGCDVTDKDTLAYEQPHEDVDPDHEYFASLLTMGPDPEVDPLESGGEAANETHADTTN